MACCLDSKQLLKSCPSPELQVCRGLPGEGEDGASVLITQKHLFSNSGFDGTRHLAPLSVSASDLGPFAVCRQLVWHCDRDLKAHFREHQGMRTFGQCNTTLQKHTASAPTCTLSSLRLPPVSRPAAPAIPAADASRASAAASAWADGPAAKLALSVSCQPAVHARTVELAAPETRTTLAPHPRTCFWRASCPCGLCRAPDRAPCPWPAHDLGPCLSSRWGCHCAAGQDCRPAAARGCHRDGAARPCLCRGGCPSPSPPDRSHGRRGDRRTTHAGRGRCATCHGRARICCRLYRTYWVPRRRSAAQNSTQTPYWALFK